MPKPKEDDEFDIGTIALLTEELLRKAATQPGIKAYKPHPSQKRFHEAKHKEKLYIGGNRSGKTVAGVAEDAMWLTGQHPYRDDIPPPPIRGRAVAVDIEDGIKKILLPEFIKWIPQSFLRNGSFEDSYDKQSRTLTLTNGSFLEFMSYEQDFAKFAGTSRHFTHFDEEPPEDIFNECLMRLVDTNGSYWISMTPLIEMSWIKDGIYDPWAKGETSVFVLEVDTEENPYISIGALNRLTRNLSAAERESRRKGTFITHTGLVYAGSFKPRDYLEGGNLIEDILDENFREYTRGWGHFVCMDHGYANPTVFLFCAFDGDGRIIIYDEIYVTRKIIKDNALTYLARLEQLKVHPLYCVGDPSIKNTQPITGTSIQSEYMEHGVPISLGNNDIRAGVARVQNRFDTNNLYITRRCVETIKELGNYRWDRYATSKLESRRNKKEVPLKRNDHCMDAMRYGVMSRPAMEGEEESTRGNVLMAATPASDFDYELVFANTNNNYDEQLGIEW